MKPCPASEDLLRLVDNSLPLEESERLRAHVAQCSRCREQERGIRMLVADVNAAVPVDLDVRAHTRGVMARLDLPPGGSETLGRKWLFPAAGSMAACALVAVLYARPWATETKDTWQSRGSVAPATFARDVGIEAYAAEGPLRALASGAVIEPTTPLTAGFRNLGRAPVFLLLFAVDAHEAVHWIVPPYARLDEDPVATALPHAIGEQMLGTTAVFDDLAPGRLRIVSVLTSNPTHVSDVEALGGGGLDPSRLRRRFHGADIRETELQVRVKGERP